MAINISYTYAATKGSRMASTLGEEIIFYFTGGDFAGRFSIPPIFITGRVCFITS